MTALTLTSVLQEPKGRMLIRYSDGTEQEYPSFEALTQAHARVEVPNDLLKQILVAQWLAVDPAGVDAKTAIEGKTLTFDVAASSPVVVR